MVLLTWHIGCANDEHFGVFSQVTIEQDVWCGDWEEPMVCSRRRKSAPRWSSQLLHSCIRVFQPTSGFYSGLGQILKSQALSEPEFTLHRKASFGTIPTSHSRVPLNHTRFTRLCLFSINRATLCTSSRPSSPTTVSYSRTQQSFSKCTTR